MNRGCLTILGLGFISLFAFGVTLEAINDPQELSAIPFSPWDFVTYSLVAVAIFSFVRLVRKRDPRKLAGKWTSKLAHGGGCICTRLRLAPDGTAAIESDLSKGANSGNVDTQARWQLLDPVTLHLWGTQTITCRILKLNSWTMITANLAGAGVPIRWTKQPTFNTKPWFVIAAAVLLPVLIAISLPLSRPSHAIADDPQYVPSSTVPHSHRTGH